MKNIENLVQGFLAEEEFSLRNSLAYAGLGLSKTTGLINEVVSGVGFSEQPYTKERQTKIAEVLGEMLFYWHVMASTVEGIKPEQIIDQYVASYEAMRSHLQQQKITIFDMMEMKRHVKSSALRDLERASDGIEKKKSRENILMK